MTSDCGIPLPGKKIFCHRPFLKEQLSFFIKKMKMHNRMKQHAFAIMTKIARSTENFVPAFVDYRKYFDMIDAFHKQ
jgi:hypothetical protein